MFNFQDPYLFFLTALLVNITPGNDVMYVASRSISGGIKAGIASAAGVFVGCFVHIMAAVLGLSIIISRSAYLFQLIKFAGAAYLIYLGIKAIVTKPAVNQTNDKPARPNYAKLFKTGAITNILNPKVAIFFLSFLPQFIDAHSPYFKFQLFTLGFWFDAQGTVVLIMIAFIVGRSKDLFKQNPKVWLIQEKITGFIFVALGIKLAFASKR